MGITRLRPDSGVTIHSVLVPNIDTDDLCMKYLNYLAETGRLGLGLRSGLELG